MKHANAQFQAERTSVAQIAAATFEDTGSHLHGGRADRG